jgi:uncharacterized protein (UPF0332 family)
MDKLEEFIKTNREDLDRYSPSPGNWAKIERRIKKANTPLWRWVTIAAMFVVILATALLFAKNGYLKRGNGISISCDAIDIKGNRQLKETEIYYNNMLNSLYREATPLLTGNPEVKKELANDISHLDSLCVEIKKDLKDNVANQEVVEALIQNYRIKIQLLEDMLTILKENENNPVKKKSYEL